MSLNLLPRSARLLALAAVVAPLTAHALTPDEVGVVVNSNSATSKAIADHYLKARNIPAQNLISIAVKIEETIDEVKYREQIVAPLRKALTDAKLDQKITCLVTTYDVPLRIANEAPLPEQLAVIKSNRADVEAARIELFKSIELYNQIAPNSPASAPSTTPKSDVKTEPAATTTPAKIPDFNKVVELLTAASKAAVLRVNLLDPADYAKPAAAYAELHQRIFGLAGFNNLSPKPAPGETPEQAQARTGKMAATLQELNTRLNEILRNGPAEAFKNRKERLQLSSTKDGLVGLCRTMDTEIPTLDHRETYSALDNELMLLWVDNYPLYHMLGNPKYIRAYNNTNPRPVRRNRPNVGLSQDSRILMVSRLDASSLEIVIKMIDTSIKVEKEGLDGILYLDARGIHDQGNPYSSFDFNLRETADYINKNTTFKAVLDDKNDLFKAKDCPDAALYAGWYSLKNYQDSCQWVPGAVGYHLASYEMISLHDPKEFGWVANLLQRGFCGTVGPVYEPYLQSFPLPSLMFPLLLSGKYTQAEIYLLTSPVVSWCNGYVGDPLYNPFKNKPRITAEKLAEHPILKNADAILTGIPAPAPETKPSTQPATTPDKR